MNRDQYFNMFQVTSSILFIIVSMAGCGDNSGGGGNVSHVQNISFTTYIEQPGDVFIYNETMNIKLSNGEKNIITQSAIESYSQVDTIPSKYFYFGEISGPYLLNTQTEDAVIDGYQYSSLLGTEIVDDDLDTFTRINAKTRSGSGEPDGFFSSGDTFTFSESSTLFDSDTGTEVGNENYEGMFTIEGTQTISVPAGSFESLKINVDAESTWTKRGATDSASLSGSFWYAIENGFLVKLSGTVHMTLNEYNLAAEAFSENVLIDYEVGINAISNCLAEQQTDFSASIVAAFIKRINNLESGILFNR